MTRKTKHYIRKMYRNGPFMYPWQKISCFTGRFYVNSFFFLEQTDVLKQTHIVITDNQVAETLWY
jgi:hypothetical protein